MGTNIFNAGLVPWTKSRSTSFLMTISRSIRAALVAAFISLGATLAQAQQTVQTWLMLNQNSQETFFVTDPAEQVRLTRAGWKVNGTAYLMAKAQPNTSAMQRLVKGSSHGTDRIFAITTEQSIAAVKAGYTSEGVLGQAAATPLTPALIPVYHFVKDSMNLWLIDKADQAWAEKAGWTLKGVAFWLWSKPSA